MDGTNDTFSNKLGEKISSNIGKQTDTMNAQQTIDNQSILSNQKSQSGVVLNNPIVDSMFSMKNNNGLVPGSDDQSFNNVKIGLGKLDTMNQSSAANGYKIMNGSNLI